nr:mitogen-activated protein kinase kinase kinase YODA-like [Tanacetum cinerariifolium]
MKLVTENTKTTKPHEPQNLNREYKHRKTTTNPPLGRPHAHPLSLPDTHTGRADSGKRVLRNSRIRNGLSPLLPFLLPKPRKTKNAQGQKDVEGDLAIDSVFIDSDSDSDSDDPPVSHLLSPQASDYDTGNKTSTNIPCHDTFMIPKKGKPKPVKEPLNNKTVPTSPKRRPYSSSGSGHNSGHNSFGGDMSSAQFFRQHSQLPFDYRNLGVLYQK